MNLDKIKVSVEVTDEFLQSDPDVEAYIRARLRDELIREFTRTLELRKVRTNTYATEYSITGYWFNPQELKKFLNRALSGREKFNL